MKVSLWPSPRLQYCIALGGVPISRHLVSSTKARAETHHRAVPRKLSVEP